MRAWPTARLANARTDGLSVQRHLANPANATNATATNHRLHRSVGSVCPNVAVAHALELPKARHPFCTKVGVAWLHDNSSPLRRQSANGS
jgi:hypothetical protein